MEASSQHRILGRKKLKDALTSTLSVKDCGYAFREIVWCNGAESRPFSKADMGWPEAEMRPSEVFLCEDLFEPGLEMLEQYANDTRFKVPCTLIGQLLDFLEDSDGHAESIVNLTTRYECETALSVVLAVHLFQALVPDKTVILNQSMQGISEFKKKCPCACGRNFQTGNTGIGSESVWHGYPDMLIGKIPVTVAPKPDPPQTDDEDYSKEKVQVSAEKETDAGGDEPLIKRPCLEIEKDGYSMDVKAHKINENACHQTVAQTVTSSYVLANEKPELTDWFSPGICYSDRMLLICAYNVKHDWLIAGVERHLVENKGETADGKAKFNIVNIVELWLMLNMERMSCKVDELQELKSKKSGFQNILKKRLNIYKEVGNLNEDTHAGNAKREMLYDLKGGIYKVQRKSRNIVSYADIIR